MGKSRFADGDKTLIIRYRYKNTQKPTERLCISLSNFSDLCQFAVTNYSTLNAILFCFLEADALLYMAKVCLLKSFQELPVFSLNPQGSALAVCRDLKCE